VSDLLVDLILFFYGFLGHTHLYPLIAFIRHVLDGKELIEVNPFFEGLAKQEGFYSDDLMRKIAQDGNIQNLLEVPEKIKKLFVTAHDISPEDHIKMQAAFQKYTDNAVSKTLVALTRTSSTTFCSFQSRLRNSASNGQPALLRDV
jgi:hypothetical protein